MEQEKNAAAQLRAARAILGLSQAKLAELAGVSSMTIKRAEGSGKPYPTAETLALLRETLTQAGVEFIADSGHRVGVILREDKE